MDYYLWKYKVLRQLGKVLYRKNNGIYVGDEKWNNLIILDACRYDMFEEEYKKGKIPGKLEYRISRGTWTVDFLKENFLDRDFKHTVYVTGNPYVDKYVKNSFYRVIPVWNSGWNEKYKTVLPSTMYEYSIKAARKYPDKRLIVHFMQPHSPFLTDRGLVDTAGEFLRDIMLEKSKRDKHGRGRTLWEIVETQKVDMKRVITAYKRNLEITLPYVNRLIHVLRGWNIVTADHGNTLGEWFHPLIPFKIYGHPCGIFRMESLVKVPWLIYDNDIGIEKQKELLEKEILKIKIKKIKNI